VKLKGTLVGVSERNRLVRGALWRRRPLHQQRNGTQAGHQVNALNDETLPILLVVSVKVMVNVGKRVACQAMSVEA